MDNNKKVKAIWNAGSDKNMQKNAPKLDGRESRKVARLQRVNSATETTKMII
jgi:hypothetical protein